MGQRGWVMLVPFDTISLIMEMSVAKKRIEKLFNKSLKSGRYFFVPGGYGTPLFFIRIEKFFLR
jgi:hypothetical protein